ncbi:hypothetical protein IBD93_05740 [Francisella tularensis]|nr:hypothetical protein [Francisella tularensis]
MIQETHLILQHTIEILKLAALLGIDVKELLVVMVMLRLMEEFVKDLKMLLK